MYLESLNAAFVIDTFLLLRIGIGPKIALVPFPRTTRQMQMPQACRHGWMPAQCRPRSRPSRSGIILRAREPAGTSGRWFTAWNSGGVHVVGADLRHPCLVGTEIVSGQ